MNGPTDWTSSPHKKNEALIPPTMYKSLKHMMFGERSQAQTDIKSTTPFIRNIDTREIHRDRRQIGGCPGLEGWGRGVITDGNKVSFWGDKSVLEPETVAG